MITDISERVNPSCFPMISGRMDMSMDKYAVCFGQRFAGKILVAAITIIIVGFPVTMIVAKASQVFPQLRW